MTNADDLELRRLCDCLTEIDATLPSDSPRRESLKKAALALQLVFQRGQRLEIEDQYRKLGAALDEPSKARLRAMGLEPDDG
jgi:hypothetical protein